MHFVKESVYFIEENFVEDFIELETGCWDSWLAEQPGLIHKQILIDSDNPNLVTVQVTWESAEKMSNLDLDDMVTIQEEFEQEVSDNNYAFELIKTDYFYTHNSIDNRLEIKLGGPGSGRRPSGVAPKAKPESTGKRGRPKKNNPEPAGEQDSGGESGKGEEGGNTGETPEPKKTRKPRKKKEEEKSETPKTKTPRAPRTKKIETPTPEGTGNSQQTETPSSRRKKNDPTPIDNNFVPATNKEKKYDRTNPNKPSNSSIFDEVGYLRYLYMDELTPVSNPTKASDKQIEDAAKAVKAAGNRNWTPVLVREHPTEKDKYEVVGNEFVHAVAKKAGMDRIWAVTLPSHEQDSSEETKAAVKALSLHTP